MNQKSEIEKQRLLRRYAVVGYRLEQMLPQWIEDTEKIRVAAGIEKSENNLCAVQVAAYQAIQKFMERVGKEHDNKK